MTQTAELAQFVHGAALADFPDGTSEFARLAILDTVGVGLAGSREQAGRCVIAAIKRYGGHPEATVWGGTAAPTIHAALANGTSAHVLDFDDMHTGTGGHPSAVLVPAVLAVAERYGSSGCDVIEAFAVGFEVAFRIGRRMGLEPLARGFHPTSVWGPPAAAAAAARLSRLSAGEVAMALGVAASYSSGLRANFGTMTKGHHAGISAMHGVMAAELAAGGLAASDRVLDEPGLFEVFGAVGDPVVDGLGKQFFPLEGYAIKIYPACGKTHSGIDSALAIRSARGRPIEVDEVEEVQIETTPQVHEVLHYDRPRTPLEAKFSLPFTVAVALLDGAAGLEQFTDDRVGDPELQALVERVRVIEHDRGWTSYLDPERVTVVFRDGDVQSHQVDREAGDLGRSVTTADVTHKFAQCAALALRPDAVERYLEMWGRLGSLDDVRTLAAILRDGAL